MAAFPLFDPKRKRKNGELSTELKDLDVDRVDGVDRPATGRSFVLYKSEHNDAATIAAVLKQLYPSTKDIYRDLIAKACDAHIVKMVDSRNVIKGYVVKGDDVSSPMFPTLDAAVKFVTKVVMGEVHRAAGVPVNDDEENNLSKPMPGAQAALDDPNVNASGQSLLDEKKRPDLWEQHLAKGNGLMLDGTRWPRKRA